MLLSAIQRLADGAAPLVAIAGTLAYRPQKKQIRLTENGRRVLAGAIDWMAINGLDHWLGGVHLRGPECPRRESPAHPTGNPTNN